ncbi:hypothetical protein [Halobacterium jilantaiense]|uniref:Uncharacterized protein n=1 Tax=Halobacterium jilantaiense TaxID=355548 RepID=A0A1I0N1T4_9EURY|nr:hypothetical protein [Halobacterium jilantaiense]SEV94308.1 hypothetical protein SAMN04487945_0502 [Halobacterium jilantaiense]
MTADPAAVLNAVAFTGNGLLVVTGLAFTFYATQNYSLDRLEGHENFWAYLTYLGLAVALVGAFGVSTVLVDGNVVRAFGDLALLFAIAFVAFSMREVYYASALAPPPEEREMPLSTLRLVEFGFVVVVAVEWLVVVLLGETTVTVVLRGVGALAFATYGIAFSERLEELAHGTTVDTLRRHLVFVLVAATGVAVAGLLDLLVPGAVGESVRYVFLVLLGGLLVPPTIRLQQSVASIT